MVDNDTPSEPASDLPAGGVKALSPEETRRRAAALAELELHPTIEPLTAEEASAQHHELRVHQIELEMYNEELRATQEALEESRTRYLDLYDLAPVGYLTLDEQGVILEANLTAANLLDVGRSALVHKPLRRFILREDRDLHYLHQKQLVETGTRQSCELRMVRAGTEVFWARLESVMGHDPDGDPVCRVALLDVTERKATEESLRQSEARFRSVFNEAAVGIAVTTMDKTHLDCNQALLDLLGLTREQFLSTKADEFTHPDDLHPDPTPWLELEAGKRTSYQRDVRYLRPDGSVVSARLTVSLASYGSEGQPVALAMMEDITERKAAEAALREALARLQAIIDSSPAAIVIQSPTHGVELYSPAAEKLFGWTAEEVLGQPQAPYVDERFEAEALGLRARVAAGETITGYETQRLHRDGSLIEVSISIASLPGGEEDGGRFVAVITDISERRRAEREAAERAALEQLLQVTERMLAELSPSGLLEQLVEGVRALTDAALCTAAYGSYGDDFAAEALAYDEAVDPSVAGVALRELRADVHLKLLEANSPVRLTDAEMATFPGFSLLAAHTPVHAFTGVLLPNTSRETVGMIMASNKADGSALSARDEALLFQLTALGSLALRHLDLNLALSRQAVELEASNRELASFSHSVSHDLRAPLRAVNGFSQALLDDYGSKLDAQALDHLTRLRAATGRMGELIDDLLLLSRVTREAMRWEEVDLSALATEITVELDESDPSRAVVWKIEPELKTTGHPRLLGVLLRNLLGNAFKFTGKTPEAVIEFGVNHVAGKTVYFVKDNGAGFDMAYADKLFAPFQRLHTMEDFPGNGVGLATVLRVINRHGGKVWAEAEVGQGATFRFTY